MIFAGNIASHIAQADLPALAEIQARFPGRGIQRDEPCIQGRLENPAAAWLPFRARGIEPRGHAPIDQSIAVILRDIDHWIVDPSLLSSGSIHREYAIESRRQIKRSINQERRSFQTAAFLAAGPVGNISSVKYPGEFELGDILAIDLRQRRITRAASIVAVISPFLVGRTRWVLRLRDRIGCSDVHQRNRQHKNESSQCVRRGQLRDHKWG